MYYAKYAGKNEEYKLYKRKKNHNVKLSKRKTMKNSNAP